MVKTLEPLARKEEKKLEAAALGIWDINEDEDSDDGVPAEEAETHAAAVKAAAAARKEDVTVRRGVLNSVG